VAPVGPRALTPARLGRPWGGGRFGSIRGEPVGELWVSGDDATLPDGRTLTEAGIAASVPLVKLLDVGAQLSVQVHPDDDLARELHGPRASGKHEAWVVLEATADSTIAVGLVDADWIEDIYSGDRALVAAALATQPAEAGMVIDVEPGTVHAPASTVLLYEVQQRSDLTYRIFDWGRSRTIHIEEARRAVRPAAVPAVSRLPDGPGRHALVGDGAPFRLDLCRPAGSAIGLSLEQPAILSVLGGEILLDGSPLGDEQHWLLEAGESTLSGSGEALLAAWR
jgi:mannose-6-phosphate isomerase